jgi:hypothetical protein
MSGGDTNNGGHLTLARMITNLAANGCALGAAHEKRVKAVEERQIRIEDKIDGAKTWLIVNLIGIIVVLVKMFWPAAVAVAK